LLEELQVTSWKLDNGDFTSGAESVDCKVANDEASNHIHIALVEKAGVVDECQSITAEMTPDYHL
jgi:hypothetical protein